MKVLLLTGADQKYGTHRMTLNMLGFMNKVNPNIKYIVLTPKYGDINKACEQMKVENHVIPYRYCVYAPCRNKILDFFKKNLKRLIVGIYLVYALFKVYKYIDVNEIDIIHTNNNRDLFGAILKKRIKKPHIMHLREFTNKDFNLNLLFSNQVHYMNTHTDYYIAVSEATREYWVKVGLDIGKVHTIYDGIDVESVKCKQMSKDNTIVRIVMCGYLSKTKGQMQLLRAINLLKTQYDNRIDVDLYGDSGQSDSYYKELEKYIYDNNLENMVHLLGYQKDVTYKLCEYDIGINCSKSEGFGLVTVEYMFAGICPIVSNTGANQELIVAGKTGMVYEFENVFDLSEKLKVVIEDEKLRKSISQNARKYAENNFSLEKYIKRISDLYQAISLIE